MSSPLALPLPWNLVAAAYAAEILPQFELYAQDALRLAGVQAGQRVADVACGPGTLALLAARQGAKVQALDFAEEMVQHLQQSSRKQGLEIEAVQGDGQALPWPDHQVDASFSMFGLIFFPDRVQGLRELARVTRPGGRLVVASWVPMEEIPAFAALFAALGEALPGLPLGGNRAPMTEEASIQAELAEAGLPAATIHRVTHGIVAPSAEEFWASMERTLAPVVLLRHSLGDEWPALATRIRAGLLQRLGTGEVRVPMTALLSLVQV
ncbi:MAG TPA: methyltransferase domain-containing protein [Myxococcota bacterium]|nr:methyltransferase domain-containing protein [Myxococcota bacterium]